MEASQADDGEPQAPNAALQEKHTDVRRVDGLENTILVVPPTEDATHFVISNVTHCTVVILKVSQSVKISGARGSRVFLGVCVDQVIIDHAQDSSFSGVCHNLLVQHSHNNLIYVSSQSRPYVRGELNSNSFGAYNGRCGVINSNLHQLKGQLDPATVVHEHGTYVSTDPEGCSRTTLARLPAVRLSKLYAQGAISRHGVEKLFEVFSSLDVHLTGLLVGPALRLLDAATGQSTFTNAAAGSGLGFDALVKHFSKRETASNVSLHDFLAHLGVEVESSASWVVHAPGISEESALATLNSAVSALESVPSTPLKSEESKVALVAAARATPAPPQVVKVTHMHPNPVLLSVHRLKQKPTRSLAKLEAALAVIFKVSTRFNQFRKKIVASTTSTVTAKVLLQALRSIADRKSPLFRRHGEEIFLSKSECQLVLDRVQEWTASGSSQLEEMEPGSGGGGAASNAANISAAGPDTNAVLTYMRIFRPGHLRSKAPIPFNVWQKEVSGDAGRFSSKVQVEKALAGDVVGSQLTPSKDAKIEAVAEKYQLLPDWAVRSEATIAVDEWIASGAGRSELHRLVQTELAKMREEAKEIGAADDEARSLSSQNQHIVSQRLRKAFYDARVREEMNKIHNKPKRGAEVVQKYLRFVKNSTEKATVTMTFEDWLRDRQAKWQAQQAKNEEWVARDQLRQQRIDMEKQLFLSLIDARSLLQNAYECVASERKSRGLNVSVVFRELVSERDSDFWQRKEQRIDRILHKNYLLADVDELGRSITASWDSIMSAIEAANEADGAVNDPTVQPRDALRFLSERGIPYTGSCRVNLTLTSSEPDVVSLSLLRQCLQKHFAGRMGRGKKVVSLVLKFLREGATNVEGNAASTARAFLRSRNGAGTIKAGTFAEAQVLASRQRRSYRKQTRKMQKATKLKRKAMLKQSQKKHSTIAQPSRVKNKTPSPVRVLSSACVSSSAAALDSVAHTLFGDDLERTGGVGGGNSTKDGATSKANKSNPLIPREREFKRWARGARKNEYWSNRYKKWMVRDNTASSPQREPWVDNVEEPDEESDGNAPAIELNGETTQGNSPESPKPDPQNSENNAQNRNATLGQSHGGSVC